MKPIADLKRELAELVPSGIADAIKVLKDILPDTSEKYRELLALEGRLNDTNKNLLFGVISNEQLQLEYNRLRKDLFDLIDNLTESDFSETRENPAQTPRKGRQGSVLYRIPDMMPLGKESRCLVRIALEKETIIQHIDFDEHVRLKDIRVSDIMLVELLDPSPGQPFKIRTISTPEQFIEAGENTDWIFYVMPLQQGVYPLALKVSVIELIQGKERRREIVLEENVEIIAEGPVQEKDDQLHRAKVSLSFTGNPGHLTNSPIPAVQPAAHPQVVPPVSPFRSSKTLRNTAFMLAGLIAFTTASWAIAPSRVEWLAVRYLADNEKAYDWFIQRRIETPLRESAYIRKAEIQKDRTKAIGIYKSYLAEYGRNGRYGENAGWEIAKLEDSPVVFLQYMKEYPEMDIAEKEGIHRFEIETKLADRVESLTDTFVLKEIRDLMESVKDEAASTRIRNRIDMLLTEKIPEREIKSPNLIPKTDPNMQRREYEKEQAPEIEPSDPQKNRIADPPNPIYNTVRDQKGQNYRTIVIGGRTWTADNLAIDIPGSWCYENNRTDCLNFGRVYNWKAANQGCMLLGPGWKLPTDREWRELINEFGGYRVSGKEGSGKSAYAALIAGGVSGFEALLAGERDNHSFFSGKGSSGGYWTKTESVLGSAALTCFFNSFTKELQRIANGKEVGLSVRCVKD